MPGGWREPPGPGGLLWAPQAGRLPDAVLDALGGPGALGGAELAGVVLGPAAEPDADAPGRPGRDLTEVGHSLARLRSAGAVGNRTRRFVVGLGHRQARPDRLAVCLLTGRPGRRWTTPS